MTGSLKRWLWLFLLIIIAGTAGVGYYLYNKGPRNVQDSTAMKVTAAVLYHDFIKDAAKAKDTYTDKVIIVSGDVQDVSVNQQNNIVTLKAGTDGELINCTMEQQNISIRKDEPVNIKGICSGIGEADADLGIKGDVYLTRCYLVK